MSDTGSRSMKVVLVHGFLDDHTAWDDVAARLGDEFETVALDLPGFGSRVDDDGPITLHALADAVVAELDRSDGPIVLVGQSMGAQVGELAAVARPQRVAALVLLTPVPLAGVHLDGEMAESFRSLGGNPEAQRQGRLAVSVSLSERALDVLVTSGAAVRPEIVAQAFDAWNDGDPTGGAPSAYTGPTWIVRGIADPFVTQEVLDAAVLPRFAHVQPHGIEGAGHLPHLEAPSEVARIVREAARSVDQVGA
jgi:esterase